MKVKKTYLITVSFFLSAFIYFFINQSLLATPFSLKWGKEKNSVVYFIEIAKDKEFKDIIKKIEAKTNTKQLDLPIGIYFIRVYGLDKANKKSKYTPTRQVTIRYQSYFRVVEKNGKIYAPQKLTLDFLLKEKKGYRLYYLIAKKKEGSDSKTKSKSYKEYKRPIKLRKEGLYQLSYYSIDPAKKQTGTKSIAIIVDGESPDYSIIANGVKIEEDKEIIEIQVNSDLQILAEDTVSGVREILYSFDKKTFYSYDGPMPVLDDKPFILYFKIIDVVGNVTPLYKKKVVPIK